MAKKEYIERGALIEKMFPIGMPNNGKYPINAKAVRTAIEQVPAADVVEVVRCKDCKWWHKGGCAFRKDCTADLPSADDFCSHGERKEQK